MGFLSDLFGGGGGGGSKTTTTSTSTTQLTREDKSVKVGGDAEIALGAEAKLSFAEPGGVVLDSPDTSGGDIVFNQYPEAVAGTVDKLIKSVDTSTGQLGKTSSAAIGQIGQMFNIATGQLGQVSSVAIGQLGQMAGQISKAASGTVSEVIKSSNIATGQLGEALSRQQIGGETILPKLVLYMTVGVGVMLIASRIIKK